MAGDVRTVFHRWHHVGSLSSQYHDCEAASTMSFDVNSGTFTMQYTESEYSNYSSCTGIASAGGLGFDSSTGATLIDVTWDQRSLIVAHAVNQQVNE
jgi:hypothetical protein